MNNERVEQKLILRGDIILADLSPGIKSEQQGLRPCLVVSNNFGNKFSPTITVVPLTSVMKKKSLPTHIKINGGEFGLDKDSIILAEGIRTIDKVRLRDYIGKVDSKTMMKVENAILINLGMLG